MSQKATILSAQTLVPMSLIGLIAGGIMWLTTMHTTSQANAQAVMDLQHLYRQDQLAMMRHKQILYDKLSEMNERLARIEGSLKHKGEK